MVIFLSFIGTLVIVFSIFTILPLAGLLFWLGHISQCELLRRYGLNLAFAVDQMGNAAWFGSPEETISSNLNRAMKSGKPKWWVPYMVKFVDFLAVVIANDHNHVENSLEGEENLEKEIIPWYIED